MNEMYSVTEREAFFYGFRLGVRLMVNYTEEDENKLNGFRLGVRLMAYLKWLVED